MVRSKKEIEADLLLARDENTSKEALLKLWNTSKSVRVRKTIAKNPNADPIVMRQAARLYLEEVLENSGFLLFAMFDKDEWVEKIFTAYNAPQDFHARFGSIYNYSYSKERHELQTNVHWAMLLSPNLNDWLLEQVLRVMSVVSFRRAIKTPSTRGKVREVFTSKLYDPNSSSLRFSLETMILLLNEEVITLSEFVDCLKKITPSSTSCEKKTYRALSSKLIKGCIETQDKLTNDLYHEALWRLILVSGSHIVKWLEFRLPANDLVPLLTRTYKYLFQEPTARNAHKRVLSSHKSTIEKNLIGGLREMLFENITSDSFTKLYEFLEQNNMKSVDLRGCSMLFIGTTTLNKLVLCPWYVRKFFMLKGCVGDWTNSFPDSITFKLFDETNNACFENLGIEHLLYKMCTINGRVVRINPDRCGQG